MLTIDRAVSGSVSASPERCMEVLADVADYPSWSSLIESAELVGDRVRVRASVLGVGLEMNCTLELGDGRAVLRRLANDAGDKERFEAVWTVTPGTVALEVSAALEAPGPARLLRGRVERTLADALLADFIEAL
jgi:polyketide cyclase/dehydrase/lipid transport protein